MNKFFLLNVEKNNIIKVVFDGFKNLKNRPSLGDFLILENENSLLLTRIEEENYFLDQNNIKEEIIKIMEIGTENIGELEKEELYRLIYTLVPLTTLSKKEKKIIGSYRNIPLHLETKIRYPSFEELLYFLNYEYLKENYKNFDNFVNFLKEKEINLNNVKEKEKELLEIFNGDIISYYKEEIPVIFNINKFLAKRTGVFARTGYGKSNAIKIILLKLLKLNLFKKFSDNEIKNSLIVVFDINGEYAFSNQQNKGFSEILKDEREFLVLTNKKRTETFVRPLKINFAELSTGEVAEMLINAFGEEIKAYTYFEEISNEIWKNLFERALEKIENESNKKREDFEKKEINKVVDFVIKYLRKILQISSSELKFLFEEKIQKMKEEGRELNVVKIIIDLEKEIALSEELQKKLKKAALQDVNIGAIEWRLKKLLNNLYHPKGIHSEEIKDFIQNKKMVILDLSSSEDWAGNLISQFVSKKIFEYNQEFFLKNEKYSVILVFEEAQNILDEANKNNDIFVRIAKEGRKFNVALIAITQQPSSISQKILSQMDNFLAFHLLNDDDVNALSKANNHYSGLIKFLLKYEPIKGQCFFYSAPEQPFVIQMKFNLFDKELEKFKKELEEFKKEQEKKEEEFLANALI
jgi:DNA helicase HerA-like ATPase